MNAAHRALYFIQDGGPSGDVCGWPQCKEKAVGVFLALDDETNQEVGTIDLCNAHAQRFATGYVG